MMLILDLSIIGTTLRVLIKDYYCCTNNFMTTLFQYNDYYFQITIYKLLIFIRALHDFLINETN